MDLFRDPTPDELISTIELIGHRINLWWDGDLIFYPGKITGYQEEDKMHLVKYDNDPTGPIYPELLTKQPWKIWNGTDEEFDAYNTIVQQNKPKEEARKPEVVDEVIMNSNNSELEDGQERSVLLLGMFFSLGQFDKPNRGQGFRDAVRCQALENMGYHVLSLDDKHSEEEYYPSGEHPGKHCTANFADARRMSASLRENITFLRAFDYIILDYFFSPAGWARTRWTDNFFKDTIPRMAEDELIRRGGQFWLPNLECVAEAIAQFGDVILRYHLHLSPLTYYTYR